MFTTTAHAPGYQHPSWYPPGALPKWWPTGEPDPRLAFLARPGWLLVVCREERTWARDVAGQGPMVISEKRERGVVVIKGEFKCGRPYVPFGWEFGVHQVDVDVDLVHRAIIEGRSLRLKQKRPCILSGHNISYGKRIPSGNGSGYLGYSVQACARGSVALDEHTTLMKGAAVEVAKALEAFPLVKTSYYSRLGRLAGYEAGEEHEGQRRGGGVGDDALSNTPLHHLNTTIRECSSGVTFGCKAHIDRDAQGSAELVANEETGEGQLAFFMWVPKGEFLKASYFVYDAFHVSVPVAGESSTTRCCRAFVNSQEEHHTDAGIVKSPSDFDNDVPALSVEVSKKTQDHLLGRLRRIGEEARKRVAPSPSTQFVVKIRRK